MDYENTRARRCVNIQGEVPASVKRRLIEIARARGISRSEVVRALLDEARMTVESGYGLFAPDRRGSAEDPLVHVNYTVWQQHEDWLAEIALREGVSASAALRIGISTGWREGLRLLVA